VSSTPQSALGDLALALAQAPGVRVAVRSTSYAPSDKPTVFLRQLQHTHIVCSNVAGARATLQPPCCAPPAGPEPCHASSPGTGHCWHPPLSSQQAHAATNLPTCQPAALPPCPFRRRGGG
jgi:hypothetical protein